jgi:hypothetical protein
MQSALHGVAGPVFKDTCAKLQQKHENEEQKRREAKKTPAKSVKRKRQEQSGEVVHSGHLQDSFERQTEPQQQQPLSQRRHAEQQPSRAQQQQAPSGQLSYAQGKAQKHQQALRHQHQQPLSERRHAKREAVQQQQQVPPSQQLLLSQITPVQLQLEGMKRTTTPEQLPGHSKASPGGRRSPAARVFQALIPGLADGCVTAAVGWLSQQLVGHPFLYIKGHRLYLRAALMKHKVMEWAAAEAKRQQEKQQSKAIKGAREQGETGEIWHLLKCLMLPSPKLTDPAVVTFCSSHRILICGRSCTMIQRHACASLIYDTMQCLLLPRH